MTPVPFVEVPYGDSTLKLVVDIAHAKAICFAFSGMLPAWKSVESLNISGYATIIKIGSTSGNALTAFSLGIPITGVADVEETIFAMGVHGFTQPLDKYLNLLATGGKETIEA